MMASCFVFVYRTDPACRMAIWDATEIQRQILFEAHKNLHTDDGTVQR